jgi:hypothetical protein
MQRKEYGKIKNECNNKRRYTANCVTKYLLDLHVSAMELLS